MKQERTPGPWRTAWHQREAISELLAPSGTGNKLVIGTVVTDEDANYIVHCVNNFDELVGALDGLLWHFNDCDRSPRIDRARAALKLAKRGETNNEIFSLSATISSMKSC